MPNHCSNRVEFTGQYEDLVMLREFLKGKDSEFTFVNIIPPPADESDSYNWCINNWGTKWDAYHQGGPPLIQGESHDASMVYTFDTAWSPPQPVMIALAEKCPHVRIRHTYVEEGMAFGGVDVFEDGLHVGEDDNFDNAYEEIYGEPPKYEMDDEDAAAEDEETTEDTKE
jgi:hypothetical protein